ncbi:MAG: hypothetical protein JXA66_07430 [Oligoflexia bacterium]|nr:hypothetical protein [Oligoflexia bacterium]
MFNLKQLLIMTVLLKSFCLVEAQELVKERPQSLNPLYTQNAVKNAVEVFIKNQLKTEMQDIDGYTLSDDVAKIIAGNGQCDYAFDSLEFTMKNEPKKTSFTVILEERSISRVDYYDKSLTGNYAFSEINIELGSHDDFDAYHYYNATRCAKEVNGQYYYPSEGPGFLSFLDKKGNTFYEKKYKYLTSDRGGCGTQSCSVNYVTEIISRVITADGYKYLDNELVDFKYLDSDIDSGINDSGVDDSGLVPVPDMAFKIETDPAMEKRVGTCSTAADVGNLRNNELPLIPLLRFLVDSF